MTVYAIQTITSYCNNKRVYAEQGDEITIIKDGDVLICEGRFGRFPCRRDKTTDIKPDKVVELTERIKAERRKPLTQAEKLQLEYLK